MNKITLLLLFVLFSCNHKKSEIEQRTSSINLLEQKKAYNLADSSITIKLSFKSKELNRSWNKTIILPDSGIFTEEAHYVTTSDTFLSSHGFPNTNNENIISHLNKSYKIYKKYDSTAKFEYLYGKSYQKEWTPKEDCHFGEGCRGEKQLKNLTAENELWMMNMMWASGNIPVPGTKYLVSANGKLVVVIGGYETGPSDKIFLGGLTREVHAFLGTNKNSIIKIALLKDQNIPIGPIQTK